MPKSATLRGQSPVGTTSGSPVVLESLKGGSSARGRGRGRGRGTRRPRKTAPCRGSQCGHQECVGSQCKRKRKVRAGGDDTSEPKKKKKRPLSGFIYFSNQHRSAVKARNPKLTFGGVGRELGKMWRELSEDEKQRYKDEAARQ